MPQMTTNLRRKTVQCAPQIPTSALHIRHICAAHKPHLRRRSPHLRRFHVRSAPPPCAICIVFTTLVARCSGGRPLPRSRAVVAGGHGRWQCTRGRGARTRASSNGVAGQAAGKPPYATTLWLLAAVARHATAASRDFFCVSFRGGAPAGASSDGADNAPSGPGSPVRCVCAAGC